MYMGAIGTDTNKSAKLKGVIRGFEFLIDGGWIPTIVEGDTNIFIHMVKELANGKYSKKISYSG